MTSFRINLTSAVSAFLVLFCLISTIQAHNVLLSPYGKSCFFEDMKKGDTLAVSFQVGNRDPSSASQLEADFQILDDRKNVIKSLENVADGDVSYEITQSGRYEYCFSNEASSIGTKDVSFNVHGVVYIDLDEPTADELDVEIRRLSQLIQDVKNEQGYIVVRERTHRNTAESTNARVKWWSTFQIAVVVVNSLFQIYYLKRFFEVKSVV
ncbi:hypothetical protein NADFUDRAFT_83394 [Nadsonia fulvescens var. elongata DSM 6958]|uniref:GOLD domain-containing protein n=1 Tax=Nadsonia fulvescens var. elongata DSM 6958 TaxID=857566 RepID=A0A1E3PJ19_9ASCO|nr:hypothetical protein NADFUDRAFT_83394 [Nadsonia fulvescens var. elongata DSM 6958]